MSILRRMIHPEVRVMDEKKGIAQYVASDETLDSYREIIRADGWRFDRFQKNAPFVDSHDYGTIEKLVGKVTDFEVRGRQLMETVQWAVDVQENRLAQLGWAMTKAGFLKAVSVGFVPTRSVSRWDKNSVQQSQTWADQMTDLGIKDDSQVSRVYLEQQQIELSSVIIPANPNSLAKSYKAGVLTDDDLEFLATSRARSEAREENTNEHAQAAIDPALLAWAEAQALDAWIRKFEHALKQI